jgi:hypothetical protein
MPARQGERSFVEPIRMSRVSIVVPDVDAAARDFEEVFGIRFSVVANEESGVKSAVSDAGLTLVGHLDPDRPSPDNVLVGNCHNQLVKLLSHQRFAGIAKLISYHRRQSRRRWHVECHVKRADLGQVVRRIRFPSHAPTLFSAVTVTSVS